LKISEYSEIMAF